MKSKLTFATLLVAVLCSTAAAQSTDPHSAVASFYRYDWSHSQIFNRKNLDARKKWFSPKLYELFRQELRKERENRAKNPTDKPFFGDGFPFQTTDQGCIANGKTYRYQYAVDPPVTRGTKSRVPVRFFAPKQCDSYSETLTVELVKVGQYWLIDDLDYGDGQRLTEDMRTHQY